MMIPDFATIAEIILFSEGFVTAASLARKTFNMYQLISRQLSQQVKNIEMEHEMADRVRTNLLSCNCQLGFLIKYVHQFVL